MNAQHFSAKVNTPFALTGGVQNLSLSTTNELSMNFHLWGSLHIRRLTRRADNMKMNQGVLGRIFVPDLCNTLLAAF